MSLLRALPPPHSPLFFLCSVYHEELNAPIRRNKEEPKARPLRVGDTEKPEPEREYALGGTEVACDDRVVQAGQCSSPAKDHGHVPSLSKLWFLLGEMKRG